MKNFTNNFKQITSRLSARWLIMALMLLLGSSSVWAAISIPGSFNNWNHTGAIIENGSIHSYSVELSANQTYSFTINDGAKQDNRVEYGTNGATMYRDNCTNWLLGNQNTVCNIYADVAGTYTFTYLGWDNNDQDGNGKGPRISVTYPDPCATYTVAGTEGLCGSNWDPSDTDNDMKCNQDGTYTITFKGISAGTHQFKICKDHAWTTAYPNDNYVYEFSDEGTYDVTITFDTNNNYEISVDKTKSCATANFSVSLPSSGVVNKGDENITASITATDSPAPAVAWTSSDETVATIDANGKITAIKGGVTTITATTKGTDSYCKDTKKDAVLTVKETPTIDITGESYGCNEEKELTANFTVGTSYSIRWYKGSVTNPSDAIGTSTKITTKGTGIYYAKITGTYINDATSEGFEFTKYTPAAAPSISIGKESICSGESTNITITDYSTDNNYTLYKGNNAVQNPTFSNGVFTVSEADTYYVTSTPKEGDCTLESAKQATGLTLSVTEVTISLNPISAPICSGTTLADIDTYVEITTNGDRVAWFEANSGGNALNEVDEIRQATYYAEATLNGCTSERVAFNVTELLNVPAKPVITPSDAAICSGNTVTLTLTEKVKGETYKIGDISVFTSSNTYQPTLNETTTYTITATNQCGSTNSELVTINVTTTPVITGPSATQPNKEITLSSAAGANTWWETSGGTLTTETGKETVFTTTSNGNYTITASNTENNITCSATHPIVVNDKFYIYIRRPKSGTTTYNQWYEKTNDADKGAHPWMKNGSEYKTGDDDYTNNNYDGYGPESTFTDCNGYVWDAFIAPGTSFFIHAPNTFQEGGQVGYATFTQVTNITSTATDLYYTINQWAGNGTKGTTLSLVSEPTRIPEVAVPVLSIDPVSGIICQNAKATITVTNPEDGVTYTLNYEGKDQEKPISYTGAAEVKYTVSEAGTYLVKAETTSGTCKGNAISIAREIQVITTSISFEGVPYVTTPWEPITITVNIPKGYNYTFNDTQLTQIASPDTPIKKVSGSEYTYSFPRPQEWGTGNSQTGDSWGEKSYTISATLNGVTESCGTTTATVKLQDEGNDNCNP